MLSFWLMYTSVKGMIMLCKCMISKHASAMLQGVANRDVKLENTLLVSSARPLIKLCDFGYSKVLTSLSEDLLRQNNLHFALSARYALVAWAVLLSAV